MYYVYILRNQKNLVFYKGYTCNVPSRLYRHRLSTSGYTSKLKGWGLVWYCGFTEKELALQFERYLKSGSGIAFLRKHLVPKT